MAVVVTNAWGQRDPIGEITRVTRDLYRFGNGTHFGVFLVTSEGIILADPVSTDLARWLKSELDSRFGVPVKYVIYSHHHYDHVEGGEIFADTAEFVAHENMLEAMNRGVSQTLPGATHDRNADAVLTRDETVTGMRFAFDRLDRNGDGLITGPEMFAEVRPPDTVYTDRMTIVLGGKRVELVHPGYPNHAPDMTIIFFPQERATYNADLIYTKRLQGGWGVFDRTPLTDWIASFEAVETLDFDILISAHSPTGTKQDATEYRQFFEHLTAAVSEGMAAGQSLEEMKDSIVLDTYSDWGGYDSHGFGGQEFDIFGEPVPPDEMERPRQGLRAHIEATYLNLIAYPQSTNE